MENFANMSRLIKWLVIWYKCPKRSPEIGNVLDMITNPSFPPINKRDSKCANDLEVSVSKEGVIV